MYFQIVFNVIKSRAIANLHNEQLD